MKPKPTPRMSEQIFYQTKLTRAPIGNERGRLTLHYIISVQTHDPDGSPYEGHPEDRARETFNLMPGRGIDDPVNLTDIGRGPAKREVATSFVASRWCGLSHQKRVSRNHRPLPEKTEGHNNSGRPHQTRSRAIVESRFRWN
jgi:hypothetical protein